MNRTKRLQLLAVVLPIFLGTSESDAQVLVEGDVFGVAELFKKEEPAEPGQVRLFSPPPDQIERIKLHTGAGVSFVREGRYAEAEAQFLAAASIADVPGLEPSWLVLSVTHQANAVAHQGRFAEAKSLVEYAAIRSSGIFASNRDCLDFLFDRAAQIYRAADKVSELDPIIRGFFEIAARSFRADDPTLLDYAHFRAFWLIEAGRLIEAEDLLARSISDFEASRGEDSPVLDAAVDRLLSLYDRQERFDESERYFRELLERREGRFGREDEKVAEAFLTYSKALRQSGRDAEADRCVARAVGIRCRKGLIAMDAWLRASALVGRLGRSGT